MWRSISGFNSVSLVYVSLPLPLPYYSFTIGLNFILPVLFFLKIALTLFAHMNFRIRLSISTKKSCWDFYCSYVLSVDPHGESWLLLLCWALHSMNIDFNFFCSYCKCIRLNIVLDCLLFIVSRWEYMIEFCMLTLYHVTLVNSLISSRKCFVFCVGGLVFVFFVVDSLRLSM